MAFRLQLGVQQSPAVRLPSSQISPASIWPLPQRLAFTPPVTPKLGQSNTPVNVAESNAALPLTVASSHGPTDPLPLKPPLAASIVPTMASGASMSGQLPFNDIIVPACVIVAEHTSVNVRDDRVTKIPTRQTPLMSTAASASQFPAATMATVRASFR
jgi:hypothetical protein